MIPLTVILAPNTEHHVKLIRGRLNVGNLHESTVRIVALYQFVNLILELT